MKTSDRREQQRQDVHNEILDAARQILLTGGMAGFTMRKLADAVGCTATNLYYHFKDKEAVLVALMEADCTAFRKSLDAASKEKDPVERLRKMGARYIDFGLKHPDHYQFMFLTRKPVTKDVDSARRGDPAQDPYAFLKAAVTEGIASGRFRAEFSDADQLAQIIWAGVHGLVALHLTVGHDPWLDWRQPKPTGRLLIEAMLNGIAKPPPA
jgi:AcrR family transcriptional regulator